MAGNGRAGGPPTLSTGAARAGTSVGERRGRRVSLLDAQGPPSRQGPPQPPETHSTPAHTLPVAPRPPAARTVQRSWGTLAGPTLRAAQEARSPEPAPPPGEGARPRRHPGEQKTEQGHQPTRREGPGRALLTQLFPRKKLAAKQPLTRRSPGRGRNPEQGAQPPSTPPPPQALGFWFVFLRAAAQGTAGGAREVSGELGELQGWAPPALPLPVLQRRLQGQRGSVQSCQVRSPAADPPEPIPAPPAQPRPLLPTPLIRTGWSPQPR